MDSEIWDGDPHLWGAGRPRTDLHSRPCLDFTQIICRTTQVLSGSPTNWPGALRGGPRHQDCGKLPRKRWQVSTPGPKSVRKCSHSAPPLQNRPGAVVQRQKKRRIQAKHLSGFVIIILLLILHTRKMWLAGGKANAREKLTWDKLPTVHSSSTHRGWVFTLNPVLSVAVVPTG